MFPCVCCGYITLSERGNSYEICSICFWEHEEVALRWPLDPSGGANRVSLQRGQRNFLDFGASEERFLQFVKPPEDSTLLEPGFRPVDPLRDKFERCDDRPWRDWPRGGDALYWWRPTYWLRA